MSIAATVSLPGELAYVAMLESGLDPAALGPDGRRGLWQLQPQIARFLNLVVRSDLDERTDPEKATQAVARYFEEQLARFGKKHGLVFCIAVYGSGEGRVSGALRKVEDAVHSNDFWYAYRMGYFDQATSDYVARAIALTILGENPQEFGFVTGTRSQL